MVSIYKSIAKVWLLSYYRYIDSQKATTTFAQAGSNPHQKRIPMIIAAIKTQINKVLHKDYTDGEFDASIKLPPQSKKPEYLFGYYNGKHVPF